MYRVRLRATEPGGVQRFLVARAVVQSWPGQARAGPESRLPQSAGFLSQSDYVQESLVRQA